MEPQVIYELKPPWWKPWARRWRTRTVMWSMPGPEVVLVGESGQFDFEIVKGMASAYELAIVDMDRESGVSNEFDSLDAAKQAAEAFAGNSIEWHTPGSR